MRDDRSVGVLGLGYVGVPLALGYHEAGLKVTGVDASPARVAELNAGHSPIDDVDDARLGRALRGGIKFIETTQAEGALSELDAVVVCVPTPITQSKDPDLGPVLAAAETVRHSLRPGQLVVLQSTTFPGTTTGPFRVELERSGLVAGRDFHLAFAPERVNPGDPASSGRAIPRLVGGSTPEATERAKRLFENINSHVVPLSSPDAAELAKLLENVFRSVNIAFVNQLALLCERMGLDVWEVVDAAATKPFGFMAFRPGPGVGGHCIPVDPYYLAWRTREFDFVERFIELAGDINLAMPRHVVELASEALNRRGKPLLGTRVGIMGVAFKPDVQDARNAPAASVMTILRQQGAVVSYHDPHVPNFHDSEGVEYASVPLDQLLKDSTLIVVVTAHRVHDWADIYSRAELVVDTVNSSRGKVRRADQVLRLGAGWAAPDAAEA
ncbi:MAG: nucleotide sugar dehydrogenase [Candidatus Limnocylindrales bacterium]